MRLQSFYNLVECLVACLQSFYNLEKMCEIAFCKNFEWRKSIKILKKVLTLNCQNYDFFPVEIFDFHISKWKKKNNFFKINNFFTAVSNYFHLSSNLEQKISHNNQLFSQLYAQSLFKCCLYSSHAPFLNYLNLLWRMGMAMGRLCNVTLNGNKSSALM